MGVPMPSTQYLLGVPTLDIPTLDTIPTASPCAIDSMYWVSWMGLISRPVGFVATEPSPRQYPKYPKQCSPKALHCIGGPGWGRLRGRGTEPASAAGRPRPARDGPRRPAVRAIPSVHTESPAGPASTAANPRRHVDGYGTRDAAEMLAACAASNPFGRPRESTADTPSGVVTRGS